MPILPATGFWLQLLEIYSASKNECIGLIDEKQKKLVWINNYGAFRFGYETPAEALEEGNSTFIAAQFPAVFVIPQKHTFTKKDGSSFTGFISIAPTSESSRLAIISLTNNAHYELADEQERFRALFNYATLGMLVCNSQGVIILSNPFASTQFGYADGELNGRKIEDLIPMQYRERHIGHREGFSKAPKPRNMGSGMNLFAMKKDGSEFPVEVSLSNYSNDEGHFVIAFIIDITQRKKIEDDLNRQREEIEQLNDDLELKVKLRTNELQTALARLQESESELTRALNQEKELSEMKSRFVSMASHEFRTPLSTILSSASLVAKYTQGDEQPQRNKHIDRIKSSVNNLMDILNEFLSIGRIEDGKILANFTDIDIRKNIEAVCTEMQSHAKPGQVISYVHEGPVQAVLDPSLLRNIVINLLSNAIKFSPATGRIIVTSSVNGGEICLSVKDNGIGIHPSDQEHLFERFFRAANATNIQGTGLGLHIVGKYVELMNGQISFKSELEKGTEFIITFGNHPIENTAT